MLQWIVTGVVAGGDSVGGCLEEAPSRHFCRKPQAAASVAGSCFRRVLSVALQPISSNVPEDQETPHGSDAQRAVASARCAYAPVGAAWWSRTPWARLRLRGVRQHRAANGHAAARTAEHGFVMTASQCRDCKSFFDDEDQTSCPDCESKNYDYVEEEAFCTNRGCANYLIGLEPKDRKGKAGGKYCEQCTELLTEGKKLVEQAAKTEDRLSPAERQLKALVANVESHLESSGTHHKTSGGGTASARERHTKADKSQALLNARFGGDLEKQISLVEEENEKSKVLGPARSALSMIKQKHS